MTSQSTCLRRRNQFVYDVTVAREEMEAAMSGISGHAKMVRGKLAGMKGEVENVQTDLSVIAEQRIYKSQV